MARHSIPQVIDDHLALPENAGQSFPAISVGTQAWYTWLSEPTTRSFAYQSTQGILTARREQRHGTSYWYAYRSQDGQLHKVYLGKSEELTPTRLHEAAALLVAKKTTSNVIPSLLSGQALSNVMLSASEGSEPPGTSHSPQPSSAAPASSPSSVPNTPSMPLLTTKLYMPAVRLNIVSRPRLTEPLNTAVQGKLTLIVAPAGWGKTTLLSAWHANPSRRDWPLAWLSLDESDNDPLRFWTYVIAALTALHPGVGEEALRLLHTTPPPPIETVLTSLLNAVLHLPTQTVLVLDDYHLIEAQPIHDALSFLLEHLPPNMHLVIASRSDPLLPLARLRARGTLTEFRAANLRFTFQETTAFLIEVMGLPLSSEQVAALQARTEGWIAGLHLAALSLQGRDDVAGFITTFTGSHRYVVDYLIEEVLSRQPQQVQDFLVQTCILDRLSGPLCDAVRKREDSRTLLEYVERTNLFLVSLDDERQWYRYHHLFAAVLRSRLQQLQPALLPELHRRASEWYEQHNLFDEAVNHALAIPDFERASRLIEQYARFTNFPSQFQILLGWLNRLPDAFVRTQPSLCLMHAITLMLTHQLDKASARVQDAERCLQEEEMPAEQRHALLSLIAAFRANLARLFGDYERCIPLAHQALELLPETDVMSLTRMFRPSTLVTAASAYLVDGNMTPDTERMVETALASVRALGNLPTTMRSISNLARLQLLQGRLRQAAITIEQATQLVPKPELQTLLNGADYYFILGDLLREWNQLNRAEQHLVQGMELVSETMAADAEMIMRGYLALARLQQACGESSQALATLDTFAQVAHQQGFAPLLRVHGTAVQVQMQLAQGNLAAAIHWAEGLSTEDKLSYAHEREYLTLTRVRIAQGREQPTGPFLSEALLLLERLLEDAEPKARMSSVLEILILRALALQAHGDHIEALTTLERALTLAEPEGYIRLLLDEGPPMLALLRQAYAHKMVPEYAATLLEGAGEPIPTALPRSSSRSSPLVEPLTAREREVLQLLIDGASNREIARQLVLSVNTVKKHVLNICGKLEVQSRTQVIAKARTLNLL